MGRHKKRGRKKVLTDAQREKNNEQAKVRWKKEHTTILSLRLVNGKDDDIKNYLNNLTTPKSVFIKSLIREKINKH